MTDEFVSDMPPTSSATTGVTEPEVVAGISSAEGSPDLPTDIRADDDADRTSGGIGRIAALLAVGIVLGFALPRRRRGS